MQGTSRKIVGIWSVMIKKVLLLVLLTLFLSSTAQATQIFFTFEGSISSIYDAGDSTFGLNTGLHAGDHVVYEFLIDTNKQAQFTLYDGTVLNKTFGPLTNESFFIDYIGGTAAIDEYREENYFQSIFDPPPWSSGGTLFKFVGNGLFNLIIIDKGITNDHILFSDITVGDSFNGASIIRDTDDYSKIFSNLTLTQITPVSELSTPVPEPSTILFLGSGLAGLVFYRRKRK